MSKYTNSMIFNNLNKKSLNPYILKYNMDKLNVDTIDELLDKIKEMSILEFIKFEEVFEFNLTETQKEVLSNIYENDISIVLCGKGSGKTSLTCSLFRYMIMQDLLNTEGLGHDRIDYVNMCSNASSARDTFYKEFCNQLEKSLFFKMFKKDTLCKIYRNEIHFGSKYLVLHTLNSIQSSFEGKNIRCGVIDEISDEHFKNARSVFEDLCGSVYTRFNDGKVIVITWTRFRTANPMSDVGYALYTEYNKSKKNDLKIYTTLKSHYEMRGKQPKGYDKDNPQHRKMYNCEMASDKNSIIDVSKINFIEFPKLLDLKIYNDNEVKFEVKNKIKKPDGKVYCHIDTSLVRDRTVIALYYNNIIEIHVIKPDKKNSLEVSYDSLEKLLIKLRPICEKISMDSFNSALFKQRYKVVVKSFNQLQQYRALMSFKNNLHRIKIISDNNKDDLLDELSYIYINNSSNKWEYLNKSKSSDIADAIFYVSMLANDTINIDKNNSVVGFNL